MSALSSQRIPVSGRDAPRPAATRPVRPGGPWFSNAEWQNAIALVALAMIAVLALYVISMN
jgi:hypothetical protein